MEQETKFIAISNQKGGVGKSAFTSLFASYLHYEKNKIVVVIDCDYPQYSIHNMRESDIETIGRNKDLQLSLQRLYENTGKKAYKIICTAPENALNKTLEYIDQLPVSPDIVLFDLPGTVNSAGVLNLLFNMDYVFVPIIPDKRVLHSSLAFVMSTRQYMADNDFKGSLKDIYFFWNRIDKRENTELCDIFNDMIKEEGLKILTTVIPDTKKYNKELSLNRNTAFRSTLFPPDKRMMRNTNLEALINEVSDIIEL